MILITIMTLIIIIMTGIYQLKAFQSWPKTIVVDHNFKNYPNFVAEKQLKVALLVICFKGSIHSLRNQNYYSWTCHWQKQPSRSVLSKKCSENMQQILLRTPPEGWYWMEIFRTYSIQLLFKMFKYSIEDKFVWLIYI